MFLMSSSGIFETFISPLSANVEYTSHNSVEVTTDCSNSGHSENYEKKFTLSYKSLKFPTQVVYRTR